MLFNSLDFAIFLPIVFLFYWFVVKKNLKLQNALIVAASFLFYGWWDWRFLSLIIFSTVVDYLMYYAPIHTKEKQKILNWNTINSTLRSELGNKYIDLSDLILDDSGFADLLHTNHNSSTKINKEMYDFIEINYLSK